ncbi:hypothetical protein [Rathayibacter rathayi]|nr:hypothetical protein [Rathayibacter rathayi]MWV76015.1 hypothetical protein [Rathayibacter rathayi NCPPB 2980 = VKM Ac-1601]
MTLPRRLTALVHPWTRAASPTDPCTVPTTGGEPRLLAIQTTPPPDYTGEFRAFDELLPAMGFKHRVVGLHDGRSRIDAAAWNIRVAAFVFDQSGTLQSTKMWTKVPTVGIDVVAANLVAHDGHRLVLDTTAEDLTCATRHALTELASFLEGAAA